MDYSLLFGLVLKLWWVIPLVIVISTLRSSWFKGLLGEATVKFIAKLFLPARTYYPIHEVTLPTPSGSTQIDHIFVSRFGVFVVETKNMKGWIFGSEKRAEWTQQLYKKSFKFQNPLRQNYKHIKALESLGIPLDALHSIVTFTGTAVFKTPMPLNVTKGAGYIKYIKSFQEPLLTANEVQDIVALIESKRLTPSRKTNRQHLENLKSPINKNTENNCPKCGSTRVLRTAKRGSNAGLEFWGCSTYPRCKATQNIN